VPGGLSNPVQGYLAFSAVKLAGYSLAGWYLNRRYSNATTHFALVGIARTVIGMIFGAALGFVVFFPLALGGMGILAYIFGLIPMRLIEWWILILIFYDRSMQSMSKDWRHAALGTVWSFVLDIPALIGLIATAGFWIC
jgi:hypothetical protein